MHCLNNRILNIQIYITISQRGAWLTWFHPLLRVSSSVEEGDVIGQGNMVNWDFYGLPGEIQARVIIKSVPSLYYIMGKNFIREGGSSLPISLLRICRVCTHPKKKAKDNMWCDNCHLFTSQLLILLQSEDWIWTLRVFLIFDYQSFK
jgi:hypothetical protein